MQLVWSIRHGWQCGGDYGHDGVARESNHEGGGLFEPETSLGTTHQQPRDPTSDGDGIGLRLACIIPEPSTVALLFMSSLVCAFQWIRRKFL